MKSEIKFADEKVQKNFEELKNSKTENKKLYKWICQAFEDLEENGFGGVRIQKRLIPKFHLKKTKKGLEILYKVAVDVLFNH